VVNVVQGGKDTVKHICEHPDIKAVSFVGANEAGEYIYRTASNTGKRAQVNMGAKNMTIVCPDAQKTDTINAIVGACFGSSGQRCMAVSVAVLVGDAQEWIPEIVEKAKTLTIGPGAQDPDVGPMITRAAVDRAKDIISKSESDGTKILLDGRNVTVEGYPNGNWLGPTIIDHSGPGKISFDEEIFAPVMAIVRVDTLKEGIDILNGHRFGNGVSIFTRSGGNARKF